MCVLKDGFRNWSQPSHHLGNVSCVHSLAWFWMAAFLTCASAKQSVRASVPRGAGLHGKVGHLDTYLRTGERQAGLFKRRTVLASLTSGPRTISATFWGINAWAFMGIPLYIICCFSLDALNSFPMCLIFVSLVKMFCGIFLFRFILFGTLWASWSWVSISFSILGNVLIIISSSFSCILSFFLLHLGML